MARAEAERDARAVDKALNVVNTAKQAKHIEGTPQFAAKLESVKAEGKYEAQSRLTIDAAEAQALVDEFAGKGVAEVTARGHWRGREKCDAGRIIGVAALPDGTEKPTRFFKIHYSKKDVHIVPFLPKDA